MNPTRFILRRLFAIAVFGLASSISARGAGTARLIVNETFSTAEHARSASLLPLDWIFAGHATPAITDHAFVLPGPGHAVARFPEQQLARNGDALMLIFDFSIRTANGAPYSLSGGLRFGLFDRGPASQNKDRDLLSACSYAGYAVWLNPGVRPSGATGPLSLRKRFTSAPAALIATAAAYRSLGTMRGFAGQKPLQSETPYRATFIIKRDANDAVTIAASISGDGLSKNWRFFKRDRPSLEINHAEDGSVVSPFLRFDTMAFAVASAKGEPAVETLELHKIQIAVTP